MEKECTFLKEELHGLEVICKERSADVRKETEWLKITARFKGRKQWTLWICVKREWSGWGNLHVCGERNVKSM